MPFLLWHKSLLHSVYQCMIIYRYHNTAKNCQHPHFHTNHAWNLLKVITKSTILWQTVLITLMYSLWSFQIKTLQFCASNINKSAPQRHHNIYLFYLLEKTANSYVGNFTKTLSRKLYFFTAKNYMTFKTLYLIWDDRHIFKCTCCWPASYTLIWHKFLKQHVAPVLRKVENYVLCTQLQSLGKSLNSTICLNSIKLND